MDGREGVNFFEKVLEDELMKEQILVVQGGKIKGLYLIPEQGEAFVKYLVR